MSLRKRIHTLEELVELQDKAIAALKLAIEALERARAEIGSQDKLPFGGIPAGGWPYQPFKQPSPFQEPYPYPNTAPKWTAPNPVWVKGNQQIGLGGATGGAMSQDEFYKSKTLQGLKEQYAVYANNEWGNTYGKIN